MPQSKKKPSLLGNCNKKQTHCGGRWRAGPAQRGSLGGSTVANTLQRCGKKISTDKTIISTAINIMKEQVQQTGSSPKKNHQQQMYIKKYIYIQYQQKAGCNWASLMVTCSILFPVTVPRQKYTHTPPAEEAEAGLRHEGPQGVPPQPPRGGHLRQPLPAGAVVGLQRFQGRPPAPPPPKCRPRHSHPKAETLPLPKMAFWFEGSGGRAATRPMVFTSWHD